MANCLGQWPDVFNKWWLHSKQNDSLMLQGEDRLLISLMIKMGLQGTLCAAVRLLNQLFPYMQYDRLINLYYSYHHLLKIASTVERKSSCLSAHSSMGFTWYSASPPPAPQGLAKHFSLTCSFLLYLFRMRKSRIFKLYQWPSHFWNIYFKALWAGHKSSIACHSHFPTDLPEMSKEEQ